MISSLPIHASRICTLFLLQDDDAATGPRLLLGRKRRGFGEGRWNGFGGKVEPGETLLAGALREMEEESGVAVAASDATLVGHLVFTFEATGAEELHVHVFSARARGDEEPVETEEMTPQWWPLSEGLPYDRMWLDDREWMPLLLRGDRFRGQFHFDGHKRILRHELQLVSPSESSPCSYISDPSIAIIIPAGSSPQAGLAPHYGLAVT